jgi:hypothetical protein
MKVLYAGKKPLNIGMNRAKHVAHRADKRDQLAVQRELGRGLPRQHSHHQQLVKQRHAYYKDSYDEHTKSTDPSAGDPPAGTDGGALPESTPGPDPDKRDAGN